MSGATARANPVDFASEQETVETPLDALAKARSIEEFERLRRAVEAAGEAAYHWDIAADRLAWSRSITQIFGDVDAELLASGRGYAGLLDRENYTSRFETVMRSSLSDEGDGVPFQIEYKIRPNGGGDQREFWVEDVGRWYGDENGRPVEVCGIIRRVDDRTARDAHSRFLGHCDPLTGMMNRGRLAEALGEAIAAAEHNGTTCAYLIASVSNLPVVNDAFGFDIADEVIVAVAGRLREVVRNGDLIGRYSGSKFGIILSACSEEELHVAAERFLSVARDSVIETERGPVWAMLSIGGLVLPKHADNPNAAMAKAEEALTEAKRQPSDAFIAYLPSPERLSVRGLNARCAAEIVSSLRENRFTLAYQPIVSARTGEIAMHEALLRMNCDDGDTVAAVHLIPIAEKLGLVRLIDRTVMTMAVDKLLRYPDAVLTLNVSGTTATDPRWFTQLTDLLQENRQVTDRLTVEITETVALNDLDETARFITSLRELGCKVAIDDFGAGYTSFRNLKVLNIDMVKIDGSFCEHLSDNRDNQYFVRSLVDLAKKFKLKTVAEWVQNECDAELLRSWDVDYLQGNFFGPANIIIPWARDGAEDQTAIPAHVFDATRFIDRDRKDPSPAADGGDGPPFVPILPEIGVDTGHAGEIPEEAHASVPAEQEDPAFDAAAVNQTLDAVAEALRDTATEPSPATAEDADASRLRAALAALDAAFGHQPGKAAPDTAATAV
jgi:diguanylate cyclase (GGDEF)-like protein